MQYLNATRNESDIQDLKWVSWVLEKGKWTYAMGNKNKRRCYFKFGMLCFDL